MWGNRIKEEKRDWLCGKQVAGECSCLMVSVLLSPLALLLILLLGEGTPCHMHRGRSASNWSETWGHRVFMFALAGGWRSGKQVPATAE